MKRFLYIFLLSSCTLTPRGQFTVSWDIRINGTAQPSLLTSCGLLGAAQFQVVATRAGDGSGTSFVFDCASGNAQTDPLDEGDYTFQFALLDDAGNHIITQGGTASATLTGGDLETVPQVIFSFTFSNVSFKVHMGSPAIVAGNCDPSGAAVDQEQIDIFARGENMCMAFSLSGLSSPDATACVPTDCQDENTTQTINGLPEGNYDFVVYGLQGGGICFIGSLQTFTVGATDQDLGLLQVPADSHLDTGNHCH